MVRGVFDCRVLVFFSSFAARDIFVIVRNLAAVVLVKKHNQIFDSDEFFGQRQITELIRTSAGPPWGKHLLVAVKKWRKSNDLDDDLTFLEI